MNQTFQKKNICVITSRKTTTEQINTGVPGYPRETSRRAVPHTPTPRTLDPSYELARQFVSTATDGEGTANHIPANQLSENRLVSRTHTEILQHRFNPCVGKISWSRKWPPALVFVPGESLGLRILVGYSPQGSQRIGHDWATEHILRYNSHTAQFTHLKYTVQFFSHSLTGLCNQLS